MLRNCHGSHCCIYNIKLQLTESYNCPSEHQVRVGVVWSVQPVQQEINIQVHLHTNTIMCTLYII